MRFCSADGCNFPVWGTCKITRKGYCKSHQSLREDFDKRSIMQKAVAKRQQGIETKVRGLHEVQKETTKGKDPLKSALLKLADKLFGDFIKKRDSDNNGNISCVCCGKIYNLEDKDNNGDRIVQPLHFVSRTIYTQRWNESQVYAGCCYCNLDMHQYPDGIAYRQFRSKLCIDLGYEAVSDMEDEKYNVNRISHSQIQEVIDKYKPAKLNAKKPVND